MSDPWDFRVWLKRQRQVRGLTQDDLGELVGYAGETIRKIEGGRRRPSPQLALRLAQALQLAPEEHSAWMAAARAIAGVDDVPPEAEPPPRLPLPSPTLPAYLTPFVGRTQEQADLAALLGRVDCRLVTVLGPGGVGKTRLAIETARVVTMFADGAAFVSLAPVAAPEAIMPTVADALGVTFVGSGNLLAQLLDQLRGRRILLILDNLEHLLDPAGVTLGLLGQLLAQAPDLTILATSRERLRLGGEWVLELGGLSVAPPGSSTKSGVTPALALFVEHAQRIDRAFRLTPANQGTVVTICGLVDGLPLGIELAAAWTRMLPLEEVACELLGTLDAIHPSPGMLPPRHHSLRSVVDHSWRLLSDAERAAMRQLSVFRGGFSRQAAAQVAGTELGVLVNLVDKSLLRRGAGGRYDLHEIIRQYADARLREQDHEAGLARDRHANYFMRLVVDREPRLKGPQQAAATAELGAEIDNLRAAWGWAVEHGWLEAIEGAAAVLQWFYEYRSWHQEGVTLFAEAAERLRVAMPAGDNAPVRRTLGRLLAHYGYLAARVGLLAEARHALAESYDLLADGRDPVGLSYALVHQGIVAHRMGDYGEARRALDQSLALATSTGDAWTQALCLAWASIVAHSLGEYHEAERLFRAGLAGWRAWQNPRAVLWCITYCSATLLALDKHQEAQHLLREALALSYDTNDRYGTAVALHHLGLVALQQGAGEEAIYFFRETLEVLRVTGSWEVAETLNDLGSALWLVGRREEARRTYGEALATALRIHTVPDALQALAGLATQLAHDGQHTEALALAARVLADPASTTAARRCAEPIQQAAYRHLPADEAARAEERGRGRPLVAILAELTSSGALL